MFPWLIASLTACFGIIWFGTLESPVWAIAAANLAGLVTLLLVQKLERTPSLKARWFRGALRTWIACTALFALGLWLLIPELREPARLAKYFLPLVFCAGLLTPWVFGPLQDRLVRRQQRKARGFTDPGTRAKS